ncbi:DNA-directed RNA polymerase subunit beta [Sedimentisphaera cyanobacteriorum]|uniref:DNA-directed RNA polymerase subunit beta n=1 Tax=Sedimentisphaera cyanobacteriorum TaxID=1940790 RepID=A0A1Q2HS97_9BACT|nr:DNA-directed RNA polymerase subunit beta [Sedimentisphaera cyanobacteriorum]AQQ10312.1 DNA-directed RNA polymerase subunit beta [Sedimentisphaera cyanobacteriorum]
MGPRAVRNFGKINKTIPVPDLTMVQRESYRRFLQLDKNPAEREDFGLEAVFRESFPIEGQELTLEYLHYALERPRYTPLECKGLKLTYGYPLRVTFRLTNKKLDEVTEQAVFLGEMPVMLGGGTFIVNGAERVIVNQLHRGPGVDFGIESKEADRVLHGGRIIPERGSWLEVNVTKKDQLIVKIDQSNKLPATVLLRAMAPEYGTTAAVIRQFYETEEISPAKLEPTMWAVGQVVDTETGEIIVDSGHQIGERVGQIQGSGIDKIEVVKNLSDMLILNTLAEDDCETYEHALIKIYSKLRPGNPANVEKAEQLFNERFYDKSRYRLGKVGRFRLNRKFGTNVSEEHQTIRPEDYINVVSYILKLRANQGEIDDIDHLGNRRVRTVGELGSDEIRKGLLKLRRTVTDRMSSKQAEDIKKISDIVNSKSVSNHIDAFFGRGELSQVVDQTNCLSQLTHERRLSALGPGGLNRKRAGFEVRDVHISHYGRICPIETPEGANIGLISSLGVYSSLDEYGFLMTPYMKVKNRKLTGDVVTMRADNEDEVVCAPPAALDLKDQKKLRSGPVLAREKGELTQIDSKEVEYLDVSSQQTVGISASLIPFLDHDDANRALMGSNMMRQAVPLLKTEAPFVGTGMEYEVPKNTPMVVKARRSGAVTAVDATKIVIDDRDEYHLRKYRGLNERTCLNQKPTVTLGEKVEQGQIIADGGGTCNGTLAIGKNLLVAFMPFDGYNFEDAILISQKVVKEDTFTSVHIDEFDVEVRETKLGREEFTRDIPNVGEKMLRNLDSRGVIREGTRVGPGDLLVGKVSPKSKTELTPEEKLLHAIFGRAGEDVKNDSLVMPSGHEGVIIGTKHFRRYTATNEAEKKELNAKIEKLRKEALGKQIRLFRNMMETVYSELGEVDVIDPDTLQKAGVSKDDDVIAEQIESFSPSWLKQKNKKKKFQEIVDMYWPQIVEIGQELERVTEHMKRGDELPNGVLEKVKIYVAMKRPLSVGDKMAGRHGNKGIIARIMPEEDMPFLDDGTPVDILLNPLGVPSRMNVGQILETHLGWAAKVLGFDGITPVFDGASEKEIFELTMHANEHVKNVREECEKTKTPPPQDQLLSVVPDTLKNQLYDGRTGEPFEQRGTVGYMYMLKLHHLVDDKLHARSTGPYSLITQQPLGGKARAGGQRFGEMEVWALEGYGAAYLLQEILTVKSDDIEGRSKIYESMVKGNNSLQAGTPVSFEVLCNEIKGLGLNMRLERTKKDNSPF